jgi:MYXO-CTERM domain-containing protein
MGLLLYDDGRVTRRFSLHHSIFAHNNQRNPRVQGQPELELINNVIYDWGSIGMQISSGTQGPTMNIVSNLAKPGPSTSSSTWIRLDAAPPQSIYVSGNIGPGRATLSDPEWGIVRGDQTAQRMEPWPAAPNPVTVAPYPDFVDDVLRCAGALAPKRDSIDARVIEEVRDGTGRIIDSPSQVGGWPEFAAGTPPADGDHDGMPDEWESAHGLDPNNAADGNTLAPSGYTWVEEHINSLFGDCSTGGGGGAPPTVPPASGTGGQTAPAMPQPQAGEGASAPLPSSGVASPVPVGVSSGAGGVGASAGTMEVGAMPSSFVPSRARSERASSGCSAPSGASPATPWATVLLALYALAARKRKTAPRVCRAPTGRS